MLFFAQRFYSWIQICSFVIFARHILPCLFQYLQVNLSHCDSSFLAVLGNDSSPRVNNLPNRKKIDYVYNRK